MIHPCVGAVRRVLRTAVAPEAQPLRAVQLCAGRVGAAAIGALLAAKHEWAGKQMYALPVAGFLTVLVGLSRIALGAHLATDEIGGRAFGSDWDMVWFQMARASGKS